MFRVDCQKNTDSNIIMTGKEYMKKKEISYCLVCKKTKDNKLGE